MHRRTVPGGSHQPEAGDTPTHPARPGRTGRARPPRVPGLNHLNIDVPNNERWKAGLRRRG
eukprot:10944939-Alexandrium_andersonii.AAC.1